MNTIDRSVTAGCRLPALLLLAVLLGGCVSVAGPEAAARLLDDKRQAAAAYQGGDYAQAAQRYRALVRDWPEEAENWFLLGNSYVRLRQPEQALGAYREALVRDPRNSRAWYNVVYLQAEALGRTVVEMQRNVDPRDPAYARINALVLQVLAPFGDEVLPPGMVPVTEAAPGPALVGPEPDAGAGTDASPATAP